jgi:hypothetical protein
MNKRSIYLSVVLISCLYVLNVFGQKDSLAIDLEKEKDAAERLLSSGIVIRAELHADGRTQAGGVWSETGYKFSDGVYLSSSGGDYKTVENARERFETLLKSAIKVLEQKGINSKKDGSKVSETALLVFGDQKKKKYTFSRVEWYKTFMASTGSNSLKHLLAYELKNEKEQ